MHQGCTAPGSLDTRAAYHPRRGDVSDHARPHGHAASRGIPPPAALARSPSGFREDPPHRLVRPTPGPDYAADRTPLARRSTPAHRLRRAVTVGIIAPAPYGDRPHPVSALRSSAARPTGPRPVRATPAAVMPRAARPRPLRRDDGANDTLLRGVVVYPLQGQPTPTDLVALHVLHSEPPPTRPRETPDRSALSGRTPGAPRVRLPQRLLSP